MISPKFATIIFISEFILKIWAQNCVSNDTSASREPHCEVQAANNGTSVSCQRSTADYLISFVKGLSDTSQKIQEIRLDCQGNALFRYESEFTASINFSQALADHKITPSQFYLANCALPDTGISFSGLEGSLKLLSLTCNTFMGTDGQSKLKPIFDSFNHLVNLERFTFLKNNVTLLATEGMQVTELPSITDAYWCNRNGSFDQKCFCENDSDVIHVRCPYTTYDSVAQALTELFSTVWPKEQKYTLYVERLSYASIDLLNHTCPSLAIFPPIEFTIHSCDVAPNTEESHLFDSYAVTCLIDSFVYDTGWNNVSIHNCRLTVENLTLQYTPDGFQITHWFGLMSTLQNLDLSMNKLSSFNSTMINRRTFDVTIPDLDTLQLSDNLIEQIYVDSFKDLKYLKRLNIAQNQISYIAPLAFQDTVALEVLDLSYNYLTVINPIWFGSLPLLKYLSLEHCGIDYIPAGTFRGSPSLIYLNFNFNEAKMDKDSFLGLRNLQILGLIGNKLSNLSDSWFPSYNLQIVTLTLPLTDTDDIDMKVFVNIMRQLTAVKELVITGDFSISIAEIPIIPCDLFTWLPLLTSLKLSNNWYNPCNLRLIKYLKERTAAFPAFQYQEQLPTWYDQYPGYTDIVCKFDVLNESATAFRISDLIEGDLPEMQLTQLMSAVPENGTFEPNVEKSHPGKNQYAHDVERGQRIVLGVCIATSIFVAVLFCILFIISLAHHEQQELKANAQRLWARLSVKIEGALATNSDSLQKQAGLLEKFYTTTTINGFMFIMTAHSHLEKALWYLFIIIFTGLMVRDMGNIIVQFRYDIQTTVNLVRAVQFKQQPFTLCMPTYSGNIWPSPEDLRTILYNGSAPCFRTDPFPLEINFFRDLFMHRLGHQFSWEGAVRRKYLGESTTNNETAGVDDAAESSVLDEFLRDKAISVRDLMEKLDVLLCKHLSIRANLTREEVDDDPDTNLEVLNNAMCEHTFNGSFGLTWYDDHVKKSACIHFPGIFSFIGQVASGYLSMKALTPFQKSEFRLDLQGYPFRKSALQGGLPLVFSTGQITTLTLVVTNALQSLEYDRARNRRCYSDCVGMTRVAEIQSKCFCRPLMWPELSDKSLPDCTLASYTACNLSTWNTFPDCLDAIPCQHWQYSTTLSTAEHPSVQKDQIVLRFNITNGLYVVTQEDFSMTMSTFLSNLGGVLGLWLGASFMGIIHLIACCCQGCKRSYQDRLLCRNVRKARQYSNDKVLDTFKELRERNASEPTGVLGTATSPSEFVGTQN